MSPEEKAETKAVKARIFPSTSGNDRVQKYYQTLDTDEDYLVIGAHVDFGKLLPCDNVVFDEEG